MAYRLNYRIMAYTPTAIVKWKDRKYAVIQYDEDQPGLYFGIVLLSSCMQTNWFANVGTGTHVQSWHFKLDAKGIGYIGNYKQCC